METYKEKREIKNNPRETANPLSAVTFSWTLPTFVKGMKRDLVVEDLPKALKEHTSSTLGDKLEKEWNNEIETYKRKNKEPNLKKIVLKILGGKLILYGVVLMCSQLGVMIAQPLLLGGLISYFTPGSTLNINEAYMYAAGLILCSMFSMIIEHPYVLGIMHTGMKLRIATCSLIYRKALSMSKMALGKTTVGQIVNLVSNDAGRFDFAFISFHVIWIGPVQTCIVTYLMWRIVGPASVIGVAALLILIPFQAWLGKQLSTQRLKTALRTDHRVHLMNEIITGIQVIKMYTWEKPFAKLVSIARSKEIRQISKALYVKSILLSFIIFHSRAANFITILAYVLLGNDITAEKVFVVSSFYSVVRQTMTIFFPQAIGQTAEALVSVERVRKFLMLSEENNSTFNKQLFQHVSSKESNGLTIVPVSYIHDEKFSKASVSVENATAKWSDTTTENTLNSINLESIPGQLTVIVGTVGSGKTSFFHLLLNELRLSSGSVKINGKISYASQEPWLFQGSVRQNILFGEPYDKKRYNQVITVCALRPDFEQFPFGDHTIVGERGISLSGGQRARVNLARAVYKKTDIYLLDDPLSAVDTHVGKHLFEDCIQGFLNNKIVILITHQLQYLETVDQIVLIENGSIIAKGTYHELLKSGQDFTKLLNEGKESKDNNAGEPNKRLRRSSSSKSSQNDVSSIQEDDGEKPEEIQETQSKGNIGGYVYAGYFKAGGGWFFVFLVFTLYSMTQILASGSDYWLTYWVNLEEHVYGKNSTEQAHYPFIASRHTCIYVFTGLILGTIIITILRSITFVLMCMQSSKNLHAAMFHSISRAAMLFFNNNPSGRILNRFSKDMGTVDELLPPAMMDVIQIGLSLVGIIVVTASINLWFLLPAAVCGVLFYFMRVVYMKTSRSVKRLEGICRSPVYTHLNASLQGLTTIRACKIQQTLINEFDYHQDRHSSAWYLFIATSRTFGYWLDLISLIFIALVTLSFLFMADNYYGGNVGLAITQVVGLTGMFQWGMRQTAEVENQMTSVERILEYSKLESEAALETLPDKKPKKSWPESGKVEFKNVNLRYSNDDPWVLKQLFFTIQPEEKVGIVGRTGAGKSSLITALFRLTEVEGHIEIDGINSSSLGLHDLRSKISIIPQEPVLFSGTLRKNLDPFDEHNDDILWSALDDVELRETVQELTNGLQGIITEGGSNLSVGQRQLVCLARAIVKNNKILVLDEATANVDPQTDLLIQETIRKKFANCTVLTIAHRLNTVMDSDKVLVMDSGCMVEFDHPHNLLQNLDGVFYGMVEQTGKNTRDVLHRIAAESYKRKKTTSDQ